MVESKLCCLYGESMAGHAPVRCAEPFAALHTCQKEQCLIRTAKCPEAFETACSKEVKFKKMSCCADVSVAVYAATKMANTVLSPKGYSVDLAQSCAPGQIYCLAFGTTMQAFQNASGKEVNIQMAPRRGWDLWLFELPHRRPEPQTSWTGCMTLLYVAA